MTHSISSPSTSGILRRLFIIAAGLAFFAGTAPAQEALRQSLAGEAAAAAGKQAASTIGYYNLMLGPVAWRFSSGLSSEYNDNVNLRPSNPDGDFIFQPSLDAEMTWPLTQNNSLNFDLGLGYMFYLQHQELDQLYINPGSGLSFDIYIKDLKINLHDRLSVTENGYENPGFTNSNSIVRMENDVGASGLLDLNDAVVNLEALKGLDLCLADGLELTSGSLGEGLGIVLEGDVRAEFGQHGVHIRRGEIRPGVGMVEKPLNCLLHHFEVGRDEYLLASYAPRQPTFN